MGVRYTYLIANRGPWSWHSLQKGCNRSNCSTSWRLSWTAANGWKEFKKQRSVWGHLLYSGSREKFASAW